MSIVQNESSLDKTFVKGDYLLQFVKQESELKAVLNLRFNVFNLELGEGLSESYITSLDEDPYDQVCHHLLLLHKPTGNVIGTYRMQTHEMAQKKLGWYSATEFDFSSMPESLQENAVELGRACIDKHHRNLSVLYLLWKGIAWYLRASNKRYFFGCSSITSQDPIEGHRVWNYLRSNGFMHKSILLKARNEFECNKPMNTDDLKGSVSIPKLFKIYISYGSRVCSEPAIDRLFKTIDFLMLFDVNELDSKSYNFFFEDRISNGVN